MKRWFVLSIAMAFIMLPIASQESEKEDGKSSLTYENVPVYKVFDGYDGYVVLYAKYGAKVGKTVLPKSWTVTSVETPAKLIFRKLPGELNPYMTVVRKDGSFYKVILTVPLSRKAGIWGVVPNGTQLEDTDKDTLELEFR